MDKQIETELERVARAIHKARNDLGVGAGADWEHEPRRIQRIHIETAKAAINALSTVNVDALREALINARLQLEYLDGKFAPTGTTASAIARIDAALSTKGPEA